MLPRPATHRQGKANRHGRSAIVGAHREQVAALNTEILLLATGAFLIAGFVKGVIGLGLPSVSLALLSLGMALPAAVQIMVVPTVVSNVWQALVGDGFGRLVRRFRTLLLATVAGVWIGYLLLFRQHPKLMTAVLGIVIAVYAGSNLAGIPLMPKVRRERIASPLVGLSTGVLAGATGNISMPAVAYFSRLGMPRNDIVQMLGILFTLGAGMLGLALAGHGDYDPSLLAASCFAVAPALLGMLAGQRIRGRLSERAFRRALFSGLLLVAFHLVWKGLA